MNTFRKVPRHLHAILDQVLEDHQITEDSLTSEYQGVVERAVDRLIHESQTDIHLEVETLARGVGDLYEELESDSKGYLEPDLNHAWNKAHDAFQECGGDRYSWFALIYEWVCEDESLRRGLYRIGAKSTLLSRMSELMFDGKCDHLLFDL